jgi:hypothetical protein
MKTKSVRTPLIFGDMNVTTSAHDRTSTNKYIADKVYQDFIKDHNLSPLPHHLPVDTNPPEPRPWTFSRLTGKDSVGNATFSFSRIDDILLLTALANTCKPSYTCNLGYLSDHVPLLVLIVPTCTLNLRIPHIVKAQAIKAAKQATLTCPVSASNHLKFTHALSDPSHGIIQDLEEALLVLTPAHTQALAFLNELQNKSARNTARLQHLSEKPAEEHVEILAKLVTTLIESVHKAALKICSSTSKSTTYDQQQEEELTQTVRSLPPNHHYSPRPEKNKRNMQSKKLHRIKQNSKPPVLPLHKCPGNHRRNLTAKQRQPSASESNLRYKAHCA